MMLIFYCGILIVLEIKSAGCNGRKKNQMNVNVINFYILGEPTSILLRHFINRHFIPNIIKVNLAIHYTIKDIQLLVY